MCVGGLSLAPERRRLRARARFFLQVLRCFFFPTRTNDGFLQVQLRFLQCDCKSSTMPKMAAGSQVSVQNIRVDEHRKYRKLQLQAVLFLPLIRVHNMCCLVS